MASDIKVSSSMHVAGGMQIAATIQDSMANVMPEVIMDRVASLIAERYVAEHYAEIAARLDQNAIANLAIADAGKKIAEEIRTKPIVVQGPREVEIYERGIFGGTRRVR